MIEKIKKLLDQMDVEIEDYISILITFCLLASWYLTLVFLKIPVVSITLLWSGMILLSIIYSIIYKRKKRNLKVLRVRFFVSAIPIYPMLFYYAYHIVFGLSYPQQLRFTPVIVIFLMLFLNAFIVFYYRDKSTNFRKRTPDSL
jgi:Zn-dependent protease with chaperone function